MKQIAYVTDIHLDDHFPIEGGADPISNWKTILQDIKSRNIQQLILGGDLGEPSSNVWFFESIEGFSADITLGNHDTFQEISKYHKKQSEGVNELYYSYEDEGFKYIFLDSSSGIIQEAQLQWLQQELRTEKKILLFIHHPIVEVDTPVDKLYPLINRNSVRKILHDAGNDIIVICGHYHMEDEQQKENVRQLVTPAASIQLIKNASAIELDSSTFSYRIIDINNDSFETKLITF